MKKMTPLFASRVKMLREAVGLSQSDLARGMFPVVKPQAVQKWEAGGSLPRPSKLDQLAALLHTSKANLIRGTELEEIPESAPKNVVSGGRVFSLRSANTSARKETGSLPLISWNQAADWGANMVSANVEDAQDWLLCPFEHGPAAFILEIGGESNYDPAGTKSYAPGDLIYVDPSREAANRSMVVVRVDHEERAQLKQLLMDERGTRMLKSLNPNWPERIAPMPDGSNIIGVVIGKWVPE